MEIYAIFSGPTTVLPSADSEQLISNKANLLTIRSPKEVSGRGCEALDTGEGTTRTDRDRVSLGHAAGQLGKQGVGRAGAGPGCAEIMVCKQGRREREGRGEGREQAVGDANSKVTGIINVAISQPAGCKIVTRIMQARNNGL